MKRLVPMFDNSGARYSIPEDRVDEFRADMGEVAEARRYRGKDGQHYTIPQDQDEAFRADMPDAVPVRSYTMADGTRRDFTMSEMNKFLRSKEYRESEDYTPPQTGSVAGSAVKGALGGAAEGAYYGGKNALAKVVTALPEAAASVGEAVGNAVNLGGNAKNAVGDWLRASGQQTKRWLGENIRGDQYDENGNLVMSGLTKDLGYEDALTKIGETAGDAAAMAVKFAPAAVAGPAYMETILASDGINAFADTFDRAKAAGYSDAEANLAGAASGLINYYGAKLMMKGGAATKDIANPLLRALGGTAFTGMATAAQSVGNKGVENAIEGKPITEGMLGAAGEGFVEGAQFHLINEVGTNAKASMQIRRETREMKEMRKENLLTATETPDGRAFLNTVVQNEGVDAAIRARKDGKDVSRKMGAAADLPDNMSAAERNAVIDGIAEARNERVRFEKEQEAAKAKFETSKETSASERRAVEARMAENEKEVAMGDRIEAEGEAQRKAAADKAQAEYDEKMAAYEEARAKRAAEKKRGVAPSKLTPLPEKPVRPDSEASAPTKPTPPELRVEKPKKPVITADLSDINKNPAQVDKETPEKPVSQSTKAENRGEVAQKLPDGRGKMVEKKPNGIDYSNMTDEEFVESAKEVLKNKSIDNDQVGRVRGIYKSLARRFGIDDSFDGLPVDKVVEVLNHNKAKDPAYSDLIRKLRNKAIDVGTIQIENGKVVERHPSYQPLENAPSRAPQEKGTTTPQTAAKPVEAQNGAPDEAHAANVTKAAEIIAGVSAKQTGDTKWHTPENHRKGAEALVDAIENKDADALRTRFNGLNKGSVRAFEAITGLKMPNTQKGQHEVVDRFCGITPEKRAEINAKRKADAEAKAEAGRRERSLKQGQEAVAKYRVQTPDGKITTLDKLIEQGWTVKKVRRGSVDVPRVIPPDGNGYFKAPAGSYEYLKDLADKHAAAILNGEIKTTSQANGAEGKEAQNGASGFASMDDVHKSHYEVVNQLTNLEDKNILPQQRKEYYDALKKAREERDSVIKRADTKELIKDFNEQFGGNPPTARKGFLDYYGKYMSDYASAIMKEIESRGYKYNKKTGYFDKVEPKSPRVPDGKGRKNTALAQIDTATPADRTSDPAIVEWAKKRGETVATGADGKAKVSEETVRRFNADQIDKAVNVTKNLIKGVKVEQVGREWSEELDNPDGADKSVKLKREGRVVGTYDPATKKVRLYSGADASTVYHELVGHAVHDWAKDNAKPLYEKLNTLAKDAPKELVDEIRRNYPDADEATIAKEIIAHIAGKKGVENITPKLKDKPTTWYAKAYVTVRDAILDFMQKVGFRRIDVKKMDSMTPMEAMDYLTEQAAKGRMLGKAEATGDGALTKLEKWAVAMYNRYMPITKVSKDAADAKALQSGKEYDFQLRNFDVKKKEFGRILAEGDIAGESVADYMRAQSAPERNRRLREEFLKENKGGNPSDYDLWVQNNGGSGWSDERAAEHMKFFNSLPEARRNAIKKAADFLWKMQKEGMDRRVEAGLISREEADALMAAEQYHIPWRSAISEFDGEWRPWRGKNNFKSGEFAKAKGRATEAGDPIAWMFEEFSDAHLRAIENETRSILARDIEASGKFGKVVQNTPENQMKELRVKGGEGQANVVNFKRDGKTYSIVLEGERGDAIASGYTNRDLAHMPKKVQAFMRWWSSTATEWSPTFAVRNLVADNLDVARIVLAEQGVKQGVNTLAKYAVNRLRVAKEMLHYAHTGEMKKGGILEQYSKEGGMIGGFQRQGYENLREQMSYENIRKQFEKDAKKGRNRTKSVLSLVPKAFVGIVHGIKTLNTYAELSSRVAMFKTNVDAGMSAKDAALYSRRITVDFNRKGNYTPVLNTVFMFSNSTLGATMRQVEAIHKGWNTPQGKRAIALLFAQGLVTAAAEAWINSDDDENEKQGKGTWKDMPEHNYTSRLGIRVGDKFYGLPGHDDPLSRISWLGSSVGRMFFGKMKKADFAKEIGSFGADMAGRFAGKGSTDVASGWNVLFPSAMQWFIQALENKDFAGRPIKRPKFDDAQPWSQNGRESTAQSWKTAAEILNSISGGNEARSGKLDFSPEMIRHTFNSVFKNVGRDAGDLIAMAEVGLQIADFDIRNAPIARNLVTKSSGNDNRFFEAQKAYKADANELKKRESWKPGEKAEYMKSHPWLREGRDGKTAVNRLINMTNRDNPRSGLGKMGITQLRKLTEGKVRRKDGTYFEPNTPISDELKDKAREMLQKRQARVIGIMGK